MKGSLIRYLSVTVFMALLSTAISSTEEDLVNLLDSVLCKAVKPSSHMIVDIRASMDRGADLIDGIWTRDVDRCVSECCDRKKCGLVLFKDNGASASGKNCYFITCGDSNDNCVLVPHGGFTTVTVRGAAGKGLIGESVAL